MMSLNNKSCSGGIPVPFKWKSRQLFSATKRQLPSFKITQVCTRMPTQKKQLKNPDERFLTTQTSRLVITISSFTSKTYISTIPEIWRIENLYRKLVKIPEGRFLWGRFEKACLYFDKLIKSSLSPLPSFCNKSAFIFLNRPRVSVHNIVSYKIEENPVDKTHKVWILFLIFQYFFSY